MSNRFLLMVNKPFSNNFEKKSATYFDLRFAVCFQRFDMFFVFLLELFDRVLYFDDGYIYGPKASS